MSDLILISLYTCLMIFGFYGSTRQGKLLNFIAVYGERLPAWARMPTYSCPPCMGSVWGLSAGLIAGIDLIQIPTVILATSGFCYILIRLFPYTDD